MRQPPNAFDMDELNLVDAVRRHLCEESPCNDISCDDCMFDSDVDEKEFKAWFQQAVKEKN